MGSRYTRANTRYMVRLETEVVRGGQPVEAFIVDLSLGGALLEAAFDPPMPVGERIDVSFRLPDLDKPLRATAEVRWVEPEAIGIQFVTGFRAKETWALGRFFERMSPA